MRHIFKLAVALVAQQLHAVAQADGQIGVAVIVKVARGAAQAAAMQARPASCVTSAKRPSPRLCSRRLVPSALRAHQKEIRLAIAVVIDEAGTRARAGRDAATSARGRRDERLLFETHRDGRRRGRRRAPRKFRKRIAALIAIPRTERRTQDVPW